MPQLVQTSPCEPSDAEWVKIALDGTEQERKASFSGLVQRHETAVRNLLRQLCRNHAIADELAQDAFLQAWLKLGTLQRPERFAGWVKRIAYREFLHSARRIKLEQKFATEYDQQSVELVQPDDELTTLLALCTPVERELMILQFGFEFTQDEIAGARNMAVGTIKSHVHRAKLKMRAHLKASADAELEELGHG